MWGTQTCIRHLVILCPELPLLSFMVLSSFPYFNADGRDFPFNTCFFSILFLADFYLLHSSYQVLGEKDHLILLCPLYLDPFFQAFPVSLFLYTITCWVCHFLWGLSDILLIIAMFYFPHLSLVEIIQHVYLFLTSLTRKLKL